MIANLIPPTYLLPLSYSLNSTRVIGLIGSMGLTHVPIIICLSNHKPRRV